MKGLSSRNVFDERASAAKRGGGVLPLSLDFERAEGNFVAEPGLWQIDPQGRRLPLPPHGYEHQFE